MKIVKKSLFIVLCSFMIATLSGMQIYGDNSIQPDNNIPHVVRKYEKIQSKKITLPKIFPFQVANGVGTIDGEWLELEYKIAKANRFMKIFIAPAKKTIKPIKTDQTITLKNNKTAILITRHITFNELYLLKDGLDYRFTIDKKVNKGIDKLIQMAESL